MISTMLLRTYKYDEILFHLLASYFSLLRQRKVTKRKAPRLALISARFEKLLSFRCGIHAASSLKRTSCAFANNFPSVLEGSHG